MTTDFRQLFEKACQGTSLRGGLQGCGRYLAPDATNDEQIAEWVEALLEGRRRQSFRGKIV